MGNSWYSTGYEAVKQELERQEIGDGPDRFWMKPGEKKELVFIDSDPFVIKEHSPKLNGSWNNPITCMNGVHDDLVCCQELNSLGYEPYMIGLYTVVDCTKWVSKNGVEHQFEVKLFPAKSKILKRFQIRKQEKGDFSGKLFSIMRSDSKAPSCGDEFEVERDADLNKLLQVANYKGKKLIDEMQRTGIESELTRLKNLWNLALDNGKVIPKLVPFNYYKLLYPKNPNEMRALLKGAKIEAREPYNGGGNVAPAAGGGGGTPSNDSNDVPF